MGEKAASTGKRREQQTLVRGMNREGARDEERAANTGKRNEQRAALPESARDERPIPAINMKQFAICIIKIKL